MSEIKNVGYTCMARCNQLAPLPFKGLIDLSHSYAAFC